MALINFPPLDLSAIVVVLKTEGGAEVGLIARNYFKDTKVFDSWAKIMTELESRVVPILKKGGNLSEIKPSLIVLVKESKVLADAFTSVLSFIPGPIGIVCSLIRAIACFYGGNIPMGLLELLGCIPGAKIGIKGSNAASKIGEMMMQILKKNKAFEKYCEEAQLLLGKVSGFNSSVVIEKLKDIRHDAGFVMQSTNHKLLELTVPQLYKKGITQFGSLLIKYRLLMLFVFFSNSLFLNGQNNSDINHYIETYKKIALDHEKQYGIPASITLAQGILESGAGMSGLARNANNHFGIKAYGGWTGGIYLAWDDEATKSKFRQYNSAAESFRDHSLFLKNNGRYRDLFTKSVYDYRGWANGLQRAGYATSPTYAKALIGYIDAYRLYAINGGVKLKPGKTVTITYTITREELVQRTDLTMDETEESEEQESLTITLKRYIVEINDVRCTILYPGETLSSIAMKYDIPKYDILEYNETTNENDIKEGDVVFLAKKKNKYEKSLDFHRVKEGETLYQISQQYGIKLASLMKLNKKSLFSHLSEGEKLWLK